MQVNYLLPWYIHVNRYSLHCNDHELLTGIEIYSVVMLGVIVIESKNTTEFVMEICIIHLML